MCCYEPGGSAHFADGCVLRLGDVDVAGGVDCDTRGRPDVSLVGGNRGRGARRGACVSGTGKCGDGAGGRNDAAHSHHFAHALVSGVGDVHVAGGIKGHRIGKVELGAGGRDSVTIEGARAVPVGEAVAGDGCDVARGRVHFANALVAGVGDIDVRACVEGDALRLVERSLRGRAAVTHRIAF